MTTVKAIALTFASLGSGTDCRKEATFSTGDYTAAQQSDCCALAVKPIFTLPRRTAETLYSSPSVFPLYSFFFPLFPFFVTPFVLLSLSWATVFLSNSVVLLGSGPGGADDL